MQRATRFDQRPVPAVHASDRDYSVIGGGEGRRGGRAVIADSGYQDQTLAPRRADCTGEQRIVGADEADRYDADAVGSHPSERTCNGDGAAARRVAPVNVRDQQRRARGCALHLAVAHDQRSDGGAVAAGGGRALGKAALLNMAGEGGMLADAPVDQADRAACISASVRKRATSPRSWAALEIDRIAADCRVRGDFARLPDALGKAFIIRRLPTDIAEAKRINIFADGIETGGTQRSEEHTSELQSLMRSSYAVLCLKQKTQKHTSALTLLEHNE